MQYAVFRISKGGFTNGVSVIYRLPDKKIQKQAAVDNITVHIGRGEIYGLIGKKRRGKNYFF